MINVFSYSAGKGECIRIQYGRETIHNAFFDTGVSRFGDRLRAVCDQIAENGERLNLLVLTHVDDDHIGGILRLLRSGWKCPFEEVRMNLIGDASIANRNLSVRQNNEVYARLEKQGVKIEAMVAGDEISVGGASIVTLSPAVLHDCASHGGNTLLAYRRDYGKALAELATAPIRLVDTSDNNRNSIICTFSYQEQRFLLTGDAWAEDIVSCVPAGSKFDLIKMPHHGSVGNISEAFPDHLQATRFMICTDGVSHPDKQTIAKLVKWYGDITVYSPVNWWEKDFFTKDDDHNTIEFKGGEMIRWMD